MKLTSTSNMKNLKRFFILFIISYLLLDLECPNLGFSNIQNSSQLFNNSPPENPMVEIIQIEIDPSPAYLSKILFVNLTIRNSGQFTWTEFDLEGNSSVTVEQGELELEGTLSDLEPGEIMVVKTNFTLIHAGIGNITFTLYVNNLLSDSETIQIEIIDDRNTTVSSLDMAFVILSIISIISIFSIRQQKRKEKNKIQR